MPDAHLKVFRGDPSVEGHFDEFDVPVEEGSEEISSSISVLFELR